MSLGIMAQEAEGKIDPTTVTSHTGLSPKLTEFAILCESRVHSIRHRQGCVPRDGPEDFLQSLEPLARTLREQPVEPCAQYHAPRVPSPATLATISAIAAVYQKESVSKMQNVKELHLDAGDTDRPEIVHSDNLLVLPTLSRPLILQPPAFQPAGCGSLAGPTGSPEASPAKMCPTRAAQINWSTADWSSMSRIRDTWNDVNIESPTRSPHKRRRAHSYSEPQMNQSCGNRAMNQSSDDSPRPLKNASREFSMHRSQTWSSFASSSIQDIANDCNYNQFLDLDLEKLPETETDSGGALDLDASATTSTQQ